MQFTICFKVSSFWVVRWMSPITTYSGASRARPVSFSIYRLILSLEMSESEKVMDMLSCVWSDFVWYSHKKKEFRKCSGREIRHAMPFHVATQLTILNDVVSSIQIGKNQETYFIGLSGKSILWDINNHEVRFLCSAQLKWKICALDQHICPEAHR